MVRRSLILTALLATGALPALADIASADAAFRAGKYDLALEEAAEVANADAFALEARTLLAKAVCAYREPPRAALDQALAAAEKALKLDPLHEEGRLQKAISLSLMTRSMSLSDANASGFGPDARKLAEGVLKDDPDNYYAMGFLAVWHVEVHRRGGTIGAAVMGASLKTAHKYYAEAVEIAPADAGLRWQWARALAAYDAKKYRKEIEAELEAALAIDPVTELDRVMQARAATLLDVVQKGKAKDTERTALGML